MKISEESLRSNSKLVTDSKGKEKGVIRQVNKKDYTAVYELVKIAFQTAEVHDGTEQEFVLKLRAGETYIPELELIAKENNEIIGHIMLTKLIIKTEKGEYVGLLVAPLCVKLEYRNKGIGQKLMYAGFEKAKEMGYTSAFLAGNPKYYNRFGFKEISEFGIENKTEIPNQYVLGCEIVNGSLTNIKGIIDELE